MTGNDIVDINMAATESNWKRKGFFEKIFTSQEQQYIKECVNPDQTVWKLWTMKESAYKLYTRQYGGRFFSPQKFSCTLLTETTGNVRYRNDLYQTDTVTTKDYVYTTARAIGIRYTDFVNNCFVLPKTKDQQQFIYKKITERYNSVTGAVHKNTAVLKDKNGIPFLNCGNLQIPVSITHHGHFAAFTIY